MGTFPVMYLTCSSDLQECLKKFLKIKYLFLKNEKYKNKLPGLDFELNCDVVEPVEAMLFRT